MSNAENYARQREEREIASASQDLKEIRRIFAHQLHEIIPRVIGGLKAMEIPRTPRDIFCFGEHHVSDGVAPGYYIGSYGPEWSDLVLCLDGTLAFDGKRVCIDTLSEEYQFTEHDTLDIMDKLHRMLEVASSQEKLKEERRFFRKHS